MYLSRVELAPRWARDSYQWHRALWQLFPGRPETSRDFLFRAETAMASGSLQLLLQSSEAPTIAGDGVRVHASKAFAPSLKKGQRLRFHLTANPIKSIPDASGRHNRHGDPKSCRVPLIRAEQQQEWLQRKLKGAAQLQAVETAVRQPLYFRRQGAAGKIVPVGFEGTLLVDDAQRLMELVRGGIGPAKSFGCGLLSLARL